MKIRDRRVLILEEVSVLERVWLVRNLLERLILDLMPVVGGLVQHEEAVLLEPVDGGAHLWVSLEYLV